jgi:hypothetical protein
LFIDECCVVEDSASAAGLTLWEAFSSWSKRTQMGQHLGSKTFFQKLVNDPRFTKREYSHKVTYHGLRLRLDPLDLSDPSSVNFGEDK